MNDPRTDRDGGGSMKAAIQFSPKQLMLCVTLVTASAGMLLFLNRISYRDRAIETLGNWVTIEAELSFALWVGSALCIGGAAGVLFKRRNVAVIAAFVALICVAACYP
jgi:hypothetical protein